MTDSASAFSMRNALSSASRRRRQKLGPRPAHLRAEQRGSAAVGCRSSPTSAPTVWSRPVSANPNAATAADGAGQPAVPAEIAADKHLPAVHDPAADGLDRCSEARRRPPARTEPTLARRRQKSQPPRSTAATSLAPTTPGNPRRAGDRAWHGWRGLRGRERSASPADGGSCAASRATGRRDLPGSGPGLASAREVARASRPRLAAGGVMDVQLPVRAP